MILPKPKNASGTALSFAIIRHCDEGREPAILIVARGGDHSLGVVPNLETVGRGADDMRLRFRQSFEVFPGVRLNLSGGGVTASFGVDGATVNFGVRSVCSTIGIPDTGRSFTTNHSSPFASATPRASVPPQGNAPTYAPAQQMREINSASVEQLTSHSLVELRDLIAKARSQREEVDQDLAEAQTIHHADSVELERRQLSWFRWFMKRRIAELEVSVPETAGEIQRLMEWQSLTHIDVRFETSEAAQRAYGALVRAFEALRQSKAIWDITSDRDTDRVRERSAASRTLDRKPVQIDLEVARGI